jgi:hypothetical protein
MGWICIAVAATELELVMAELLSHFHGTGDPTFEVYNAWSLDSLVHVLYLSASAYESLQDLDPACYDMVGAVEQMPPSCDLLMGDQTRRNARVIRFTPTFISFAPLVVNPRHVPGP